MNLYRLYKDSKDQYIITYRNERMVKQTGHLLSFCGSLLDGSIQWDKCTDSIANDNQLVFVSQDFERAAAYPYDKLIKALEYVATFNLQDEVDTQRKRQFEHLQRKNTALSKGVPFIEECDLSTYHYSDALRDVQRITTGALND